MNRRWIDLAAAVSPTPSLANVAATCLLIRGDLRKAGAGNCVVVDLADVQFMSYSFCLRVVQGLVRVQFRARDRYVIIANPNLENHEVLHAVLDTCNEAALVYRQRNGVQIVGAYPPSLRRVFEIVKTTRRLTAAQLAARLDVSPAAAAEKLRRLHSWGFVTRESNASATLAYRYSVLDIGTRPESGDPHD